MRPAASFWFEIWKIGGSGSKKFRFFHANVLKISIFTGKNFDFSRQISENSRFFSGKHFRMTCFSHLLQNVRLSRKKLPFTTKFWANYSISLEKSQLSNILSVHDKI